MILVDKTKQRVTFHTPTKSNTQISLPVSLAASQAWW